MLFYKKFLLSLLSLLSCNFVFSKTVEHEVLQSYVSSSIALNINLLSSDDIGSDLKQDLRSLLLENVFKTWYYHKELNLLKLSDETVDDLLRIAKPHLLIPEFVDSDRFFDPLGVMWAYDEDTGKIETQFYSSDGVSISLSLLPPGFDFTNKLYKRNAYKKLVRSFHLYLQKLGIKVEKDLKKNGKFEDS